ncbi:hypothetical protein PIB30_033147 [Stylosanthes scabra]|uniref:Uncharacterized protein n=1 Tax=Stylosanthes scabra TaxID=79078 RepID=A0ABU6XA21_9FABA|nr:hypothetical protein [Stylosanthes scabra]
MRPIAPFSPRPAASPSSSASSGSVGSVHRERSRSPRTPLPPMAPAPVPGPVYPVPRTPMCDARRYRSLFSRHRVGPPTPPPPSPPPINDGLPPRLMIQQQSWKVTPTSPMSRSKYFAQFLRPITLTPRTNRSVKARAPVRHRLATILPGVCPWVMDLRQADRQVTEHQTTIW